MGGSESLAEYLAQNYLTADKRGSDPTKRSKKKKKRENEAETTILIDQDDLLGGSKQSRKTSKSARFELEHSASHNSQKSRSSQASWKVVSAAAVSSAEQTLADAVLESASLENRARAEREAEEEAPTVLAPRAGLQTAADIAAEAEARRAAQQAALEELQAENSGGNEDGSEAKPTQRTVYRDASGRIVDVAIQRAQARARAAAEEKAKKAAETAALLGDVQRAKASERRAELENARNMGVARAADDAEMNDMLRKEIRMNDPAAALLAAKSVPNPPPKTDEKKRKDTKGDSRSNPKHPAGPTSATPSAAQIYRGAFEPNRYGIRPGYRWDGVNRSNGFERKYLEAANEREYRKTMEYTWQMDE